MLRKDVRSIILSFLLGDGCLHYTSNRVSGSLTIDHGIIQADYQKWKAELLSQVLNRKVKVRTGHKGNSVQVSVCFKRFKAWRKWLYPNNKKDVTRVLKYINNPIFAFCVWLMDDGYCEPSFSKVASGEKKLYGAFFRIFTCAVPLEHHEILIKWFTDNLGITPKILFSKQYPFLKFTQKDTLKIWEQIREFILQFKSMRYKFRYVEQIYQLRMLQRSPSNS